MKKINITEMLLVSWTNLVWAMTSFRCKPLLWLYGNWKDVKMKN